MTRQVNLILGPPGTGKTTELIQIVEDCLNQGIPPSRIAFVSFTKKAAEEARGRAMVKFALEKKDLPWFKTLHALAYQQLGIMRGDLMDKVDYKEIAKLLGTTFKGYGDNTDGIITQNTGDSMLQLIGLAKATKQSLKKIWQYHEQPVAWHALKLFDDTIEKYKQDTNKIDFSDMLEMYVEQRLFADVDIAIIDEAQDLSNAQWDMCKTAFRKAHHVYIAGDDDQAIYEWSGANVERLLNVKAETKVLNKTYRLPLTIYNEAIKIAGRIGHRYKKEWWPADDRLGSVSHLNDPAQIPIKPGESWMLLARNGYLLTGYKEHCEQVGIPYRTNNKHSVDFDHYILIREWEKLRAGEEVTADTMILLQKATRAKELPVDLIWHDALVSINVNKREYYLACLRNGFKLTEAIYIGTIHSVKGGEADNVALITDMSWRSYCGMDKNPDAEHRVFFVGATRARENLYIIDPQTDKGYAI